METASTIILSRTDSVPQAKLDAAVEILREHNAVATVITTPWSELTGEQLISAMEGKASLAAELAKLESERLEAEEEEEEHHHHHHDDNDDEHEHHHDHDGHCCCHDHEEHEHHHHHDEDEHDENCTCGCHDHHHHHHHADEVFTSWGTETARKFEKQTIENALKELDSGDYGAILRAKGILPAVDGTWIHFDYVPEEHNVRTGSADVTGKLCVIGSKLDEKGIAELFGV